MMDVKPGGTITIVVDGKPITLKDSEWHKLVVDQIEALIAERNDSERKLREICMAHGPALIKIHDLEQELATLQAERDDYKKSYEDLKNHYTENSLMGQVERLEKELATATAREEKLTKAMNLYKDASYQGHSSHWDKTGGSGSGCLECIRASEIRQQAEEVLKEAP